MRDWSMRVQTVEAIALWVRRIAHSTGALGLKPGNAPAFGPAASPGGWECHSRPGIRHKSWDVVVQWRSMTGPGPDERELVRPFVSRPSRPRPQIKSQSRPLAVRPG